MDRGNLRCSPRNARSQRPSLAATALRRILESRTPWREAALESFRRRNAILDGVFYDVGKVTREEALGIAPWLAREGAILVVPPTGVGSLVLCGTVDDFAKAGGSGIRTLVVAGSRQFGPGCGCVRPQCR